MVTLQFHHVKDGYKTASLLSLTTLPTIHLNTSRPKITRCHILKALNRHTHNPRTFLAPSQIPLNRDALRIPSSRALRRRSSSTSHFSNLRWTTAGSNWRVLGFNCQEQHATDFSSFFCLKRQHSKGIDSRCNFGHFRWPNSSSRHAKCRTNTCSTGLYSCSFNSRDRSCLFGICSSSVQRSCSCSSIISFAHRRYFSCPTCDQLNCCTSSVHW
jgi:hypothetical protein